MTDSEIWGALNLSLTTVEKHIDRETLRALAKEYGVHFNLKTLKQTLARGVCLYWLRNGEQDKIVGVAKRAEQYWQERITKEDKHKPLDYYETRLERAQQIILLLDR